MASANYSVFITAQEARQNPIRERAVHDEARGIESAILDAVKIGLYETTVSNGTPMTDSTALVNEVWTIDPATDELYIPHHPFANGDAVTLSSTIALPAPLKSTSYYYVIYVDPDHIKLASSYKDAVSGRPISIDVTAGVTSILLTDQGSGYIQPPVVTVSGGGAITNATARAYLAPYGSVVAIANTSNGSGYTDLPTVQIVAQGSGAAAGTVLYQVVGISISNAGNDYHLGDVITVAGGTGTAATAIVSAVDTNGSINSITLSNTGSYSVLPTLSGAATTVLPGGGTGATVNLTMGVKSISVASGGTGYTAPPRIIISDPSGVAAFATASVIGGSVSSISVINHGYGYVGVSGVTFDSGSGASAIAAMQPTSVASCVIENAGDTYTSVPVVYIETVGAGAAAGTVSMKIVSCQLTSSGLGYSKDDYLLVAGGVASENAVIKVTSVDSAGRILTYFLDNGGVYTTLPGLDSNPVNGGTGTLAGFNLVAGVEGIDVAVGGSGYSVPPIVTVDAPSSGGTQAIAHANIALASVESFTIVNPGFGYTGIPNVSVANGSGAVAAAYLNPTTLGNIYVTVPGSGYTYANVVITGGGATVNAIANANIVAGSIDIINITNVGAGYTSVPTISIEGDGSNAEAGAILTATGLAGVEILVGGSGYNIPPTVYTGGNAIVSSVMTGTGIDRIVVTSAGINYTADPTVYLIPGTNQSTTPLPPAMIAQRGYSIDNISILSTGVGYSSVPTVIIAAPQQSSGIQATANAYIGAGAGTFGVRPYPNSRDYFKAWKSQPLSNEQLARPYIERMDTVINYFTNLGYTINRLTNSSTNATITWKIQW